MVAITPAHHDRLDAILGNEAVVFPYFGGIPTAAQRQQHIEYVWTAHPFAGHVCVGLEDGATGALHAAVSLCDGELSYVVDPGQRRQGHARLLIRHLCEDRDLRRIHPVIRAAVFRDNLPSRQLLESLGFVFQGLYMESPAAFPPRATLAYAWRGPACAAACEQRRQLERDAEQHQGGRAP